MEVFAVDIPRVINPLPYDHSEIRPVTAPSDETDFYGFHEMNGKGFVSHTFVTRAEAKLV